MNTLNSKSLHVCKLNLKNRNKNMALANLNKLSLNITTINLKFLLQLGMMNLICLMDHILFLIYKIILNTSSKNMKLLQIMILYKFM